MDKRVGARARGRGVGGRVKGSGTREGARGEPHQQHKCPCSDAPATVRATAERMTTRRGDKGRRWMNWTKEHGTATGSCNQRTGTVAPGTYSHAVRGSAQSARLRRYPHGRVSTQMCRPSQVGAQSAKQAGNADGWHGACWTRDRKLGTKISNRGNGHLRESIARCAWMYICVRASDVSE
eukprot:5480097-Pleurochrysis_carterae.AAC.5